MDKNRALTTTEKILYTFIIVIGCIFLVLGVKAPPFVSGWEAVFQGFGGAFLGIGMSSILNSVRHFDFLERINIVVDDFARENEEKMNKFNSDSLCILENFFAKASDLLNTSLGNEFKSDKEALQEYNDKLFYEYHITKSRDKNVGVGRFII